MVYDKRRQRGENFVRGYKGVYMVGRGVDIVCLLVFVYSVVHTNVGSVAKEGRGYGMDAVRGARGKCAWK